MSNMWHVRYNPRMGEWRVYDENWFYVAGYKTHAEAMAYADRRARTVEVVLPKAENWKCIAHEMSTPMFVKRVLGDYGYGIYLGHRHMLTVTTKELKPLALHLLALHYAKESK